MSDRRPRPARAPRSVVLIYKSDAPTVLEGFGFGAALLAMFMRVGGGIFTKAADVGADLVGKVEQGIPEDDPRNAATIADNVGDNVGDCAGMAADLFESYAVTLVAALILGKAAFGDEGLVFPLIVPAIGVLTAIIGIFITRLRPTDRNGMPAINRALLHLGRDLRGAVRHRRVRLPAQQAVRPDEHRALDRSRRGRPRPALPGDRRRDHRHRARVADPAAHRLLHRDEPPPGAGHRANLADRPGHRHPVRHHGRPGVGRLLRAAHRRCGVRRLPARWRFGRCSACSASRSPAPGCSPPSASSSRWTPSARSRTTPRASPRCPATSTRPGRRVLTDLDAVGNTTKAITKGIAIATAVLAATALFGSFTDSVKNAVLDTGEQLDGSVRNLQYSGVLNVSDPKNLVGLIIGASVVFMFSVAGDQRGVPRGRRDRVRGAPPVPGAPGDHGGHRASRSTARSSTSAPATRCASSRLPACWPSSRRSRSASASASVRSAPTSPARSRPAP